MDHGWRPGAPVTVLSDGEAALPGLVRAAVREPVTCILDWWHISMRVQHIQQSFVCRDHLPAWLWLPDRPDFFHSPSGLVPPGAGRHRLPTRFAPREVA